MKLCAVIINYRTPDMTLRALGALMRELESIPDSRVILVNNDAGDGSLELLCTEVDKAGWSDRVSVVETGHNGGFAYGVNFATEPALASDDPPEYVYLLNSDAFPDPGSVAALLDFLDAHPAHGIAGSYIHGPDGDTHTTAFRFPSLASELEGTLRLGLVTRLLRGSVVPLPVPEEATRVDWLAGASMLIRADVFRDIGAFDDTFFLYYEETDFCRRARAAGWQTWYVPASRVTHIGSASTGMKDRQRRRPGYWFASRAHYFRKNHGRAYLWLANLLWVTGFSLWRVRRALQRKPDPDPPGLLGDFVRAWLSPAQLRESR